jgi:16S rRNA (guanine(966)-N(2))-methyltransferase RsmD
MRIIAGEFRSRRLKAPPGKVTRPTPDRLRESLFSILQPDLAGVTFLDAYAGSGAVGLEALSRGAARCIFIERDRAAAGILRENLKALEVEARCQLFTGKATDVLRHQKAEIIFLDPPYDLENEYGAALALLGSHPAGLVLAQHSKHLELAASYGRLSRFRQLRQSDNVISFYRELGREVA